MSAFFQMGGIAVCIHSVYIMCIFLSYMVAVGVKIPKHVLMSFTMPSCVPWSINCTQWLLLGHFTLKDLFNVYACL